MFGHGGSVKVFVATRPVDFRKGIDGLALAVQGMFGMDRVLRGSLRVPRETGGQDQALDPGSDRHGVRHRSRTHGDAIAHSTSGWKAASSSGHRCATGSCACPARSLQHSLMAWIGEWSDPNGHGARWRRGDWQAAPKCLFLLACKGIL